MTIKDQLPLNVHATDWPFYMLYGEENFYNKTDDHGAFH